MKKLLFIGALLVAGATSFGAVSQELTGTGSDYQGNASLKLITRGAVVDAVGKPMLVVTPILSAGPDGQSLSFNFGELVKGQSQSLAGKFTVQVVTEEVKQPGGTGTGKLIPLPFKEANVSIKLASTLTGDPNGTIEDQQAVGVKLYGDKLSGESTREEIGQLSYFLKPIKTNDTTYTGDVTAIVNPSAVGTFVNDDVKVDVSVTNFTFSPITAE